MVTRFNFNSIACRLLATAAKKIVLSRILQSTKFDFCAFTTSIPQPKDTRRKCHDGRAFHGSPIPRHAYIDVDAEQNGAHGQMDA